MDYLPVSVQTLYADLFVLPHDQLPVRSVLLIEPNPALREHQVIHPLRRQGGDDASCEAIRLTDGLSQPEKFVP